MIETSNLLVCEFSGTPRGGKGTVVGEIASQHEGVATEETGLDYRIVTGNLLEAGQISPEMLPEVVSKQVSDIGLATLTDIVASRADIVAEKGTSVFYEPHVAQLVGSVASVKTVRQAVKAGFVRRVEAVRDSGDHSVLLVDGRNLDAIIETIPRTRLLMRTFITCLPIEATRRECARSTPQIPLNSEAARTIYESIGLRTQLDADRELDPVRPDQDAIDYWGDSGIFDATIRALAVDNCWSDYIVVLRDTLGTEPNYDEMIRRGVGSLAVTSGRQIRFDTTPFSTYENSLKAMVEAANIMFNEGLEAATA